MAVERTLILIKPDGVARNLTGVILARIEAKGYRIVALRQRLADADPGTIRGDFATSMPNNLIHGSDSPESAQREISLWFRDDELV